MIAGVRRLQNDVTAEAIGTGVNSIVTHSAPKYG
jgi:hypothetical protein